MEKIKAKYSASRVPKNFFIKPLDVSALESLKTRPNYLSNYFGINVALIMVRVYIHFREEVKDVEKLYDFVLEDIKECYDTYIKIYDNDGAVTLAEVIINKIEKM